MQRYLGHQFVVIFIFLILLVGLSFSCQPSRPSSVKEKLDTIRVMSFNILYGGDEVDFSKVVEAIQLANPDIIGLQEAEGNTEMLAKAANYPYFDSRLHVISKFPLIRSYYYGWYYTYVEIEPGKVLVLSNVHLPSDPYGPELVRDGKPIQSVYDNELKTRFHELDAHKKHFSLLEADGFPILLTGDFNAPSHLDWDSSMIGQRSHIKYAVRWPVAESLEKMGYIDTYRAVFPNPHTKPGLTWTPGFPAPQKNPTETHDRIDFIWASGIVKAIGAQLVGEANGPDVDFAVTPYPSDHRGVISTCVLKSVTRPNYIQTKNRLLEYEDTVKLSYFCKDKGPFRVIIKNEIGDSIILDNIKPSEGEIITNLGSGFIKNIEVSLKVKNTLLAQGNFWRKEMSEVKPTLRIPKKQFHVNEAIPITWQNSAGNRFDWVAVYPKSSKTTKDYGMTHDQSQYLIYKYTMGEVSGSFNLDSLSKGDFWPLKPGNYMIHLLLDDGFQSLAAVPIQIIDQ